MPTQIVQEVQAIIAQFAEQVNTTMPQWTQARNPAAFIDAERAAQAFGRRVADELVAFVLRHILNDGEREARSSRPCR